MSYPFRFSVSCLTVNMEIKNFDKLSNPQRRRKSLENIYKNVMKNYHDWWMNREYTKSFLDVAKQKLLVCKELDSAKYIYDRYYHKLFTTCNYVDCKEEAHYVDEFCEDHQQDHVNEVCILLETYLPCDLVNICFHYMIT